MSYISPQLRELVITRANKCCEYCRIRQDDQFFKFEIDHIIAEKHQGATMQENLCLACPDCNAFKGSDISSIDWEYTESLTALFNPRTEQWHEHFSLDTLTGVIVPLSPVGRVTIFLLKINLNDRVADRLLLMDAGRYPCVAKTS